MQKIQYSRICPSQDEIHDSRRRVRTADGSDRAHTSQDITQKIDKLADNFQVAAEKGRASATSTVAFIVSEERFPKAQAVVNRLNQRATNVQTLCKNKFAILVCACAVQNLLRHLSYALFGQTRSKSFSITEALSRDMR